MRGRFVREPELSAIHRQLGNNAARVVLDAKEFYRSKGCFVEIKARVPCRTESNGAIVVGRVLAWEKHCSWVMSLNAMVRFATEHTQIEALHNAGSAHIGSANTWDELGMN